MHPLPLPTVSEVRLLQPSVADEVLLLVNVAIDPLRHHRDLNILMTTERTDSLSYAGVRENLVLTLDQVTLNSWNEVLVQRFDGEHALVRCLRDFLNSPVAHGHRPRVRVHCFCPSRARPSANGWKRSSTPCSVEAQGLQHRYLYRSPGTPMCWSCKRGMSA